MAGRVVDRTGAAVAGAQVSGSVPGTVDRDSHGRRETKSEADGSFLLEALPATMDTQIAGALGGALFAQNLLKKKLAAAAH